MDATTYFYLTHFTATVAIGAGIFFIGLLLAWVLWRNRPNRTGPTAQRIAERRAVYQALENEVKELESAMTERA